jgi:hypothetical protein
MTENDDDVMWGRNNPNGVWVLVTPDGNTASTDEGEARAAFAGWVERLRMEGGERCEEDCDWLRLCEVRTLTSTRFRVVANRDTPTAEGRLCRDSGWECIGVVDVVDYVTGNVDHGTLEVPEQDEDEVSDG